MRLINADDLIEHLDNLCELNCPYTKKQRSVMCDSCFMGMALDEIDNMPTIEAEPVRHGHWIKKNYVFDDVYRYECSECHYFDEHSESRKVQYCWQCGALMDEVNDD